MSFMLADRAREEIRKTKRLARVLVPAIRERARRMGWAIGIHGSLEYDIDLIAAPWTQTAERPAKLIDALMETCKGVTGYCHCAERCPEDKPHGRKAWTLHIGGPYIDISVMPRLVELPEAD